jgi:hypothetical protein
MFLGQLHWPSFAWLQTERGRISNRLKRNKDSEPNVFSVKEATGQNKGCSLDMNTLCLK